MPLLCSIIIYLLDTRGSADGSGVDFHNRMAGIKDNINVGKQIVLYNQEALKQIFKDLKEELDKGGRTSDYTKDESTEKSPEKKKDKNEWRRLPDNMHSRECLIVCSGGECPESVQFVPKERDNSLVDSDPLLLRRELDIVQEKMRQDSNLHIVQVCTDYPGVQMGRDYYLEKVKQVMVGCKQAGGELLAFLWCVSLQINITNVLVFILM